ncbi:MAG: hypothetical protein ACNA7J_00890 [Wenzhouxiangella sp.]
MSKTSRFGFAIPIISAITLASVAVFGAELIGEWSNDPDNCDEMRVIYAEDGSNPTKIKAGGEWVEVSEGTTWEREGDELYVQTGARVDTWTIAQLDEQALHLVNQDPEAAEFGVGEAQFYRCDPR